MHTEKISISLPEHLFNFLKQYKEEHNYQSSSSVVQDAIRLLQRKELETYYLAANSEIDDEFEVTTFDGLSDETW
jgi:antitoxin ParD1/3/4